MSDEKWQNLVDSIKDKFEVLEHKTEDILREDKISGKPQHWGFNEYLIFSSPLAKMKLERIKTRLVLDKKTHYHRKKTDAVTEFILSENEFSDKVKVYKDEGGEWKEIDIGGLYV